MKKRGSISEFTDDRNRELHHCFISVLRLHSGLSLREMFGVVAACPASRFWVSEPRAHDVISLMLRGRSAGKMLPKRREMFEEILRRVRRRMADRPGLCLKHAVGEVILEPAPEFYMTAESVRTIIYDMRRKARLIRRLRNNLTK